MIEHKIKSFADLFDFSMTDGGLLAIKKNPGDLSELVYLSGMTGFETVFKYEGPFDKHGEHTLIVYHNETIREILLWGSISNVSKGSRERRLVDTFIKGVQEAENIVIKP